VPAHLGDAMPDIDLTMIRHRGEVLVLGHNRAVKLLLEKAAKEAIVNENTAINTKAGPVKRWLVENVG
jgi:ribosomal protein L30E